MENKDNQMTSVERLGSGEGEEFRFDLPIAFGVTAFGANTRQDVLAVARYVSMQVPETLRNQHETPSDFLYSFALNQGIRKARLVFNALVAIGLACEQHGVTWLEVYQPAEQNSPVIAQEGPFQAVHTGGQLGARPTNPNSAKSSWKHLKGKVLGHVQGFLWWVNSL
jgi:hypothetical protein